MANKNLEIAENWINQQRISFERKDTLMRLIKDAIKEAEDDVRREMKKEIDDIKYEYEQKAKTLTTPSNAFIAMLSNALVEHPEIIKDAAEDIITNIAEDVAEKEVESHVRSEHNSGWDFAY